MVGDLNIGLLKSSETIVSDYFNIHANYGIDSVIRTATKKEYLSGTLVSSCIDDINIGNLGDSPIIGGN